MEAARPAAVAVDRAPRRTTRSHAERRQAHHRDVEHHAPSAGLDDEVVASPQPGEVTGDVERVHRVVPGRPARRARISSVATRDPASRAGGSRGRSCSSSSLIRSIEAWASSRTTQRNSILRQPDVRFDDRADHRRRASPISSPRSRDTEGRARVCGDELRRQTAGPAPGRRTAPASSNRFPAMVVCRVARSAPMFSIGNSMSTSAAWTCSGGSATAATGCGRPRCRTSTTWRRGVRGLRRLTGHCDEGAAGLLTGQDGRGPCGLDLRLEVVGAAHHSLVTHLRLPAAGRGGGCDPAACPSGRRPDPCCRGARGAGFGRRVCGPAWRRRAR